MFSKRIPVGEKLAGVTGRPRRWADRSRSSTFSLARDRATPSPPARVPVHIHLDRKSTRLNSSHVAISYAVFCLKKKKKKLYLIFNNNIKNADRRRKLNLLYVIILYRH